MLIPAQINFPWMNYTCFHAACNFAVFRYVRLVFFCHLYTMYPKVLCVRGSCRMPSLIHCRVCLPAVVLGHIFILRFDTCERAGASKGTIDGAKRVTEMLGNLRGGTKNKEVRGLTKFTFWFQAENKRIKCVDVNV